MRVVNFLNQAEIAAAVGVSAKSIANWTAAGMPHYRPVGGAPKYILEEVIEWMKKGNREEDKKEG